MFKIILACSSERGLHVKVSLYEDQIETTNELVVVLIVTRSLVVRMSCNLLKSCVQKQPFNVSVMIPVFSMNQDD